MSAADEKDIKAIETRFNEAWNRHDPDGMVESLAEDAQFITVNGVWMKSRAEFDGLVRRLHGATGPLRESMRETLETDIRFLAPDVAMVHSRFRISATSATAANRNRATVVASGWYTSRTAAGSRSPCRTRMSATAEHDRRRIAFARQCRRHSLS